MRDYSFIKKNWFGLITISLSLVILIVAIFLTGEKDDFFAVIKTADTFWIFIAFIFILLYWILDALTLNVLTKPMYKNYKLIESFKTGMIGLLYSALTPFSTGGQPMQIYEMKKTGVKTGDACSIITVKSIIYQAVMTIYGVAVSFVTWHFFKGRINNFVLFVFLGLITNIAFICCIIFICLKKGFTKKCAHFFITIFAKIKINKNPGKSIYNANVQIDIFYDSVRALKNESFAVFTGIVITFLQLTFFYSIPYCIYRGLNLSDASLLYMISANAIIAMITAFVPIPGASGAAEVSFHWLFAMFFNDKLLLSAVLIWRVITYYSCIMAGAFISLFMISREKREKLKLSITKKRLKY